MISIDPANQSDQANYKLLIGSIIPRPIALVTTISEDGIINAAPYSYFNIVTANPPLISISVQRKQGIYKDTSRNAIAAGAFVVHICDESYIHEMNQTAANLPPDESEVTFAGLTSIASEKVAVPGIAEAKIRMECVLEQVVTLGGTNEAPACDLIIGRVVCFHLDESIYQNGRIDAQGLKPVSRLAGEYYSKLGEMLEIARPQ
ncbi:Flavoredoxin [compost metagenome]